jgi:hypothetical protein
MMDWRSHTTVSAELHEGRTLAMQIRKNLRLLEILLSRCEFVLV